jgi:spermidine synthase
MKPKFINYMAKPTPGKDPKNQNADKISFNMRYFYLIAFIEGASVMAIELAGAKMIAPYYGTSLYVWASVLAVTLGGLTAGYFIGGWATYRFPPKKILFSVLFAGTILISLMPILALKIMPATSRMGLRFGSLVSAMSYMVLPLICMGMVSPTIIQLNNTELKGTGKTAGTIYAISTIGGIIMTLLMGFYFLPEWGIRKSVYLTAALMGSMVVLLVILYRRYKNIAVIGIMVFLLFLLASHKLFKTPGIPLKYLYESEGILGQVTVLQNPDPSTKNIYRHLFINHIAQTWANVAHIPVSDWAYPHRLATLASIKPAGSRVLLIGLGGGSLVMELRKLGFDVDVVEIDHRIPKIAEKYFAMNPKGMNIYIDDGRHFMHSTSGKYDLIAIDVLNGEVQPYHMFTSEAFAEMKNILAPNGLLIINNQGYIHGEHGKGSRSIYKTLTEAGYVVKYFSSENKEESGDVHFMASPVDLDFHHIDEARLNECCREWPHLYNDLISDAPVDLADAVVLTDDKPNLEKINLYENEKWRSNAIGWILKRQTENNIPFFN